MKIKVLEKTPGCMPEIFRVGDWIDLKTAKDIHLNVPIATTLTRKKPKEGEEGGLKSEKNRKVLFNTTLIPLGVAMELPAGYEAVIIPRSSTFKKFGIMQTNSVGLIDNSYKGNNDEWKMPVIATREVSIPKGTRIAQFRIQLSQKASIWQKIKSVFSLTVRLQQVDSLEGPDRKGFGEGTDKINLKEKENV